MKFIWLSFLLAGWLGIFFFSQKKAKITGVEFKVKTVSLVHGSSIFARLSFLNIQVCNLKAKKPN